MSLREIVHFLFLYTFFGFPYFMWAGYLLWRPVDSQGKPRLPAAAQILAPLLLELCVLAPFWAGPLLLLGYWLVPRERPLFSRPDSDRIAWTICAFGISLMVTMALFGLLNEGEGSYRSFATIRRHSRIFLVFAAIALAGPTVVYAIGIWNRRVTKTPRDSLDEPFIG